MARTPRKPRTRQSLGTKSGESVELAPPNFLQAWREEKGLSQEELGEYAGVDHTTIGRLEKGTTFFKKTTINRVLDHLQISAADLFGRHPKTSSVWTYARALEALSEEKRCLIYAMIRTAQGGSESSS
jgi:transcriptional regulator with XRE-family HTH domain